MADANWIVNGMASLSPSEFYSTTAAVFIFVAGIVIYCIFIYTFYKLLARRDIFKLELYKGHKKARIALYILEYLILFPLFVFIWFCVMSMMLSIVSEVHTIGNIFMVSIAVVASIRVVSYFKEELSCEMAKLLPFALLGVMIVDTSYFSLLKIVGTLESIPLMWETLLYYLIFTVILEFVLRAATFGLGKIKIKYSKKSDSVQKQIKKQAVLK